jgi:hypothetical protein
MYCVIQEIQTKKPNKNGHPKELISKFMEMSMNGHDMSHYYHFYGEERFERPIKKAYKISIHQSYRENGEVKKNQYPLCTARYYDIADGWFNTYDYCSKKIIALSTLLNVSEEEIYNLIDTKLDPLIESIQDEFSQTEEYKVQVEHKRITTLYAANKVNFNEKYQCDKYDHIYDVFGNLMNKDKLDEVKAEYKARQEYEKSSRSYHEEFYGNYNKYFSGAGSGYSDIFHSNHNSEDKEALKQFYRVLSKKFHPDSNPDKDTSNEMKLLNQIKDQWGI